MRKEKCNSKSFVAYLKLLGYNYVKISHSIDHTVSVSVDKIFWKRLNTYSNILGYGCLPVMYIYSKHGGNVLNQFLKRYGGKYILSEIYGSLVKIPDDMIEFYCTYSDICQM